MTTQVQVHRSVSYRFYSYVGLLLALCTAEALFVWGWFLNGSLTVAFLLRFGVPLPLGWLVHLGVSVIEQHLWRAKSILIALRLHSLWAILWPGVYLLIFVVSLLDTGSSSIELAFTFNTWGLPWAFAFPGYTLSTLVGQVIAVGSEPLVVVTGILIARLWRARRGYVWGTS